MNPADFNAATLNRNPHLTNPVTSYTPLEEGLVRAKSMKPRARLTVEKYPALIPFLLAHGLPEPVREFQFHPIRKWRFDYAWVAANQERVALEIEGGAYIQGRHNRGASFVADMLKYSTAASMGWLVIRRTPEEVMTTETVELLKRSMGLKWQGLL